MLDRIQCFPDLAVGSGRPSAAELRATSRIYITNRNVTDGELSAAEANALLHEHLARLSPNAPLLILEGGSISLLRTMAADPPWRAHNQTWERLRLPSTDGHLAKAESRVLEMLMPSEGTRSMMDEIASLWPDVRSHAVLRGIIGYRTAIAYAERCGIPITELPRLPQNRLEYLAKEIASEYLVYARQQEHELPERFS